MKKDYLAFNRFILTQDNLSLEEGYMMNVLFQCHNIEEGYAYPPYKTLMKYCKTNRQAKVSKILKSLVSKGYITIQNHKNNRYFIVGINEFIQGFNDSNNDNNTDDNNSNNNNTDNNDNNTNSKDNSISNSNNNNSEFEGLTVSQEKTLMKLAKTKERLKEIIEYSRSKAKNLFAYCYRLLKDNIQVNTSYSYNNSYANSNNHGNISTPKGYNSFNNFKAREYDYEDLEWRLLGWK